MKKLLYITFVLLALLKIYGQDNLKQLVITEVKLDQRNQEFWIEICNPSEIPLVLSSMRISWVKTPSILPHEYQGQNGIELKSGERIIICSDIKSFQNKYGFQIRAVELKLLKDMSIGGFIAINHITGVENSKNVFRFGPSERSSIVAEKVGDNAVLNFTNDDMSYHREILKDNKVSSWLKTIPTPGK